MNTRETLKFSPYWKRKRITEFKSKLKSHWHRTFWLCCCSQYRKREPPSKSFKLNLYWKNGKLHMTKQLLGILFLGWDESLVKSGCKSNSSFHHHTNYIILQRHSFSLFLSSSLFASILFASLLACFQHANGTRLYKERARWQILWLLITISSFFPIGFVEI